MIYATLAACAFLCVAIGILSFKLANTMRQLEDALEQLNEAHGLVHDLEIAQIRTRNEIAKAIQGLDAIANMVKEIQNG